MEPALIAPFLDAAPTELRAGLATIPDLARRVWALVAEGRQAWPEVAIEPDRPAPGSRSPTASVLMLCRLPSLARVTRYTRPVFRSVAGAPTQISSPAAASFVFNASKSVLAM